MARLAVENECVVLLHGIGHSMLNMLFLDKMLKKRGYKTYNISYPSLKHDIPSLSAWLDLKLTDMGVWGSGKKVHFVTHSLGGLVCGFYLQDYKDQIKSEKLGRVVMLGTPHGGSEVADGLQRWWLYRKIFGPAGQQLTTNSRQNSQITPDYDLGIIAGNRGKIHPVGWYFMKDEHDGCVSIKNTKIQGMKDHIIAPVSHSFMAWNPKIKNQILHFLKYGEFQHAS